MSKFENQLILTIVNRGFSDVVMDAAKEAGARGGTIITARGTGSREAEKFFGITIQPEKELVLILAPEQNKNEIMKAITKKTGLAAPGQGITFSLPVDDVMGLTNTELDGKKDV